MRDAGVTFWGTRGSTPVSGARFAKYGGNTSCVEARLAGRRVILDAGSGLVPLGTRLMAEGGQRLDIFFSHFHVDHICGLPFFAPAFDARFEICLHGFGADCDIAAHLDAYMRPPHFPITRHDFRARMRYFCHDAKAGIDLPTIDLPTIDLSTGADALRITALPIPHPGGAHALCLAQGDTHIVYATDTEHQPDQPNEELIALMRGARLVLYDCTYDDAEFARFVGWGHSTWQEGIRLARLARPNSFAIFHHAPDRSDDALDAIATQAQRLFANSFVARDYQHIAL